MKKILLAFLIFYSSNSFCQIESVAPLSGYFLMFQGYPYPSIEAACSSFVTPPSVLYIYSPPSFNGGGQCFIGSGSGTFIGNVVAERACPNPPNAPYFTYNSATLMCERVNPCPNSSILLTTVGWSLGFRSVGSGGSVCDAMSCLDIMMVTSSNLGINTWTIDHTSSSCQREGVPLPPKPLIVNFTPVEPFIPALTPSDKSSYDQLVADKAAADAQSAAAAAASAAATAATAAQAAVDQAAADAYIASVIARANALKAGLPVLNVPQSPVQIPIGTGGTTGGGTPAPAVGTPAVGTPAVGTPAAGTPAPAAGTASCATFSICNVEQYLNDIKNALGFGQSFDATAADAKVATMEKDNKSALDKFVSDANSAQAVDEASVVGAFSLLIPVVQPMPFTGVVMGKTVSIDISKYTEMIREILGWLWAVFGAYTIYGTIFRR